MSNNRASGWARTIGFGAEGKCGAQIWQARICGNNVFSVEAGTGIFLSIERRGKHRATSGKEGENFPLVAFRLLPSHRILQRRRSREIYRYACDAVQIIADNTVADEQHDINQIGFRVTHGKELRSGVRRWFAALQNNLFGKRRQR